MYLEAWDGKVLTIMGLQVTQDSIIQTMCAAVYIDNSVDSPKIPLILALVKIQSWPWNMAPTMGKKGWVSE